IKTAIERYYNAQGGQASGELPAGMSVEDIMNEFDDKDVALQENDDSVNVVDLENAAGDAPVVKLVNLVLVEAIKKKASDIHIEPYEKDFRVRYRIDGMLYEVMKPPGKLKNSIVARLKVMADLDIAERRLPQDGRIKLKVGNKEMDYRVSVLPTLFGEKVVMRLLDKSNLQLDMTKLGLETHQINDLMVGIRKPYGMCLVTGPTGSGKTTTLYSALAALNSSNVNISTAEDPVEFNFAGINQVQMHDDIGLNFAAALRSFLRQDPNIIMVGEIRDFETAEIAVKASLTGHMVLSTLHTNDAPSTVTRLLNMGIEPFLVTASVNVILAQRLARRVCKECAQEIDVPKDVLMGAQVKAEDIGTFKLIKGKGCKNCSDTGYKGRVALYEILTMKDELKEFVLNGASTGEIKNEAIRVGMQTLRASAIKKLKEGITTVEEVLRVSASD
ncbi:MAG: Flp pilus assembly complex ATPase component TadA, partial [Flavobacteriales bacterium]|nr:Flp pilus assembly complex ATPase component TadA [Flavobacteriales bacterium]